MYLGADSDFNFLKLKFFLECSICQLQIFYETEIIL